MYNTGPVIECSDEACTLRFMCPCEMSGMVGLVGECWDANITWNIGEDKYLKKIQMHRMTFLLRKVYFRCCT